MKMNPSLDKHGLVHFNSALLSIVRLRLGIHLDTKLGWDHENTRCVQGMSACNQW